MTTDSEALDRAEKWAENELSLFDDENECSEALENSTTVLSRLPLHSLANRIAKYLGKKFFMAGYMARKAEEKGKQLDADVQTRVQENFRTMKLIAEIMSDAAGWGRHAESTALSDYLKKKVEEHRKAIKPDVVARILGSGDVKRSRAMKELVANIEQK